MDFQIDLRNTCLDNDYDTEPDEEEDHYVSCDWNDLYEDAPETFATWDECMQQLTGYIFLPDDWKDKKLYYSTKQPILDKNSEELMY